MSAIVIISITISVCIFVYYCYSQKIKKENYIMNDKKTPAHKYKDFFDFFPEKVFVLFSHQFSSTIGIIILFGTLQMRFFGWKESFLWIVISFILIWGMQEFLVLYVVVENRGKIFMDWMLERVSIPFRILFFLIIWLFVILLIALTTNTMVDTFTINNSTIFGFLPKYQEGTLPGSTAMIVVLFIVGTIFFQLAGAKWKTGGKTVAAILIVIFCIYAGNINPLNITRNVWLAIIFLFIVLSAITPIRNYTHARDYLSSIVIFLFVMVMFLGLLIANPYLNVVPIKATYANLDKTMMKSTFSNGFEILLLAGVPFGIGSLVSAGTTAKRLHSNRDILKIGGGSVALGMITAILVLIITATGKENAYTGILAIAVPFKVLLEENITGVHGIWISSFGYLIVTSAFVLFLLASADTCLRSISQLYVDIFKYEQAQINFLKIRYMVVAVTAGMGVFLSGLAFEDELIVIFKICGQCISFFFFMLILIYTSKSNRKIFLLYFSTGIIFMICVASSVTYLIGTVLYVNRVLESGITLKESVVRICGCFIISIFVFLSIECMKIFYSEISRRNSIETMDKL